MPQFTIHFCSRISLFNVFFFPQFYSLSSLTLGGPALCLNFGPSSELGVIEGMVPLLLVYFRAFSFIKFLPFPYRVLFHFIPKLALLLLLLVISPCVI